MLTVNADRLWNSLMEMAQIAATEKGGSGRLALSKDDQQGRMLFADWCKEQGMTMKTDAIGNLFARLEGQQPDALPVVVGSHLDTQPKGGRFDGVYGVLAGLEVVRCLVEQSITTLKPIEIAVWTNEEGARFTPAMLGSAVFIGELPLAQALLVKDTNGISVADELQRMVNAPTLPLQRPFDAYFEAHIEQGPVLENEKLTIGVVTGGQAICWLDVEVKGVAAHAGTTPMPLRKDSLFAVAEMAQALERLAADFAPDGLVTIGQLAIAKSSRNTIAGQIHFTVDLRNPDDAKIAKMEQIVYESLTAIAEQRGVEIAIHRHWLSPATPFDETCVELVHDVTKRLAYRYKKIISGAGHDAIHLAKHCPTAMIFIPCKEGLSHNEAESITKDDAAKGADVLLNVVLARAQ